MDVADVVFAALIVLMAIPFAVQLYRKREGDKTSGTIALIAGVLLGTVNVVRSLGLMPDGPTYWTLNTAFATLFWVMLIQFLRAERRDARGKPGGRVS